MAVPSDHRIATRSGVGLRLPHLRDVVATRPPAAWLEIHPENFLANPHATELLADLARDYPISVHTVGASIGSVGGIDRHHLARIRSLVDLVDPILVSGHLAWSTHGSEYLNDLLPLPYTDETLRLLARHIDEVQDGLGRPYLIENPSSYARFGASTMTEVEFLSELVRRTGCRLLCNVGNIHVSAHNLGFDPYVYIDGLPADAIGELHLGGFTAEEDGEGSDDDVLIDTHAAAIAEPVWELYAHAVRRFGPRPTLIEWDSALPAFATLLDEAARADAIARPRSRRSSTVRSLAEAQARIRAAIIEGEAAAAVPLLVGGHDPATRLAIHQRHYQTSLVTALLAKFPAVEWLAGTPFVTAAAQEFVRRRAPTSPCIAEYGEDFPDFMADRPGAGRMPYLRWFGHLEWHLGQVALAIERPSLPAHVLAGLAPEALPDVVLRVQPGLRYLEAPWPVDDVMTLFLTEAAPERYVLDPIGVSLEIRGARGTFAMTRLGAGAFAFRRGIMEGRPIAAAAEGALAADPAFEPGRALRALFADGLVTAVTSAQRGDTW